jgi:hypothetical protein
MRQTAYTGAGLQKPGATACLFPLLRAWREKISIIFANNPQVLPGSAVKEGQPVIRPKKIVTVLT